MTIVDKILAHLKIMKLPQTPREIASDIGENPNTVRSELSQLHKKGQVSRPSYGYYAIHPLYDVGVMDDPPRVQNLRVASGKLSSVVSDSFTYHIGQGKEAVKLSIVFGAKRQRITWKVGTDIGLDLVGLRLVKALVDEVCAARGFTGISWTVTSVEFHRDFQDVSFEGIKCLTFNSLEGALEKYYNKKNGVRHEVKLSKKIPIESLMALVQGGLPVYQIVQGVFNVGEKVDQCTTAVKYSNLYLTQVIQLFEELLRTFKGDGLGDR